MPRTAAAKAGAVPKHATAKVAVATPKVAVKPEVKQEPGIQRWCIKRTITSTGPSIDLDSSPPKCIRSAQPLAAAASAGSSALPQQEVAPAPAAVMAMQQQKAAGAQRQLVMAAAPAPAA